MNERIDKLIEQCTVQNFSDCIGGYETFDKEKFAELLIRECLDIVDSRNGWINDENQDSQFVYGYETAIRHCSVFIKAHFGVEE